MNRKSVCTASPRPPPAAAAKKAGRPAGGFALIGPFDCALFEPEPEAQPQSRRQGKLPAVRKRGPAGFTLIELLVVIAIIALLVTLLMPSLKQAKELARQVKCMANQRGISLALNYYANEDDGGHFPPTPGWANASNTFSVYAENAGGGTGAQDGWYGMGLLFTSGMPDTERLLYCPSQKVSWFTYPFGWNIVFNGRRLRYCSYLYRMSGQTQGGALTRKEIDELHRTSLWTMPTRFALSSDIFGHSIGESWAHRQPPGLSIGFGDGHAEFKLLAREEYERCIYYNNSVGEHTGGPYRSDTIRDPFVFHFWKAIDSESFAYLRQRWPLP